MSDNKAAYTGKDYPVHTNGPWMIEGDQIRTAINSGFKHVAMVNYFNCGSGDPRTITNEEHEANAKLIAAAPDLLAALMHLEHNARVSGAEMGLALEVAKDAIAKAVGHNAGVTGWPQLGQSA